MQWVSMYETKSMITVINTSDYDYEWLIYNIKILFHLWILLIHLLVSAINITIRDDKKYVLRFIIDWK